MKLKILFIICLFFSIRASEAKWMFTKKCDITLQTIQGIDPVMQGNFEVSFFSYVPRFPNPNYKGKVLVHPPTGGITLLDRKYARRLCKTGASVVLIKTWTGYIEYEKTDFDSHDRATQRGIAATEYVINYLDAPTVFLGTSLGALYSSVVMEQDPRVLGAVFIVGGGPFYKILARSNSRILRQLREKRMKEFNIPTIEEYEETLKHNTHYSNLVNVDPDRSSDLMLIIGMKDKTVPTDTQINLWEAWGRPERITFKKSHMNTVIAAFLFKKKKMLEFLRSKID